MHALQPKVFLYLKKVLEAYSEESLCVKNAAAIVTSFGIISNRQSNDISENCYLQKRKNSLIFFLCEKKNRKKGPRKRTEKKSSK